MDLNFTFGDNTRLSLNRTQLDNTRLSTNSMNGTHFSFYDDETDALVTMSQAIFDDFKNWSVEKNDFRSATELYHQTIDNSVKIVQRIMQGERKKDRKLRSIIEQLIRERNAYFLIMKLQDAENLVSIQKENEINSFLTKLFIENVEFRRLATLLHWSEEVAFEAPTGFATISEAYGEFEHVDNIFSKSTMSNEFVHFDSRFDKKLPEADEISVKRLNNVMFSLIRCGRLNEAKNLTERVGLPALGVFLILREMLSNPDQTPIDPLNDEYGLAESRMYFKQTARELVQLPDDKILHSDQCLWSMFAGFLDPLISFCSNTDDRLWSYLTCAVDSLLDDTLAQMHDIKNAENQDSLKNKSDNPKDVNSIFKEVAQSDPCPYFEIYRHIATNRLPDALIFMRNSILNDEEPLPHKIRFFAHLVVLLKQANIEHESSIGDDIILHYIDVLIDLKLYSFVPYYVSLISLETGICKLIDFFYEIRHDQRQEVLLQQTSDAGFDIRDLCVGMYEKAKSLNKIVNELDETNKAFHNLISCWKWLTSVPENIFRGMVEANAVLRKMLYHNHVTEALEFMGILPDDLTEQVELTYQREFGDGEKPVVISDALKEYLSYLMYFETIENYNAWLRHSHSSAPELPAKIPDDVWARMDIRRRTEYDYALNQARDAIKKHMFLGDSLKSGAIESFENILRDASDWLVSRLPEYLRDSNENREREFELVKIHERYLMVVVQTLISLHSENDEAVMSVALRLSDPQLDLYKHFSIDNLSKLLELISKAGGVLIDGQ